MAERDRIEYLCIRGVHRRDLQFQLVRSYSTQNVRRWPKADGSCQVELLAEDGVVLLSEFAEAEERWGCEPGAEDVSWWVTGYIALLRNGQRVRLRRGDFVLLEQEIPPAPSLSLPWRRKTAKRGESLTLNPRVSKPADPSAWVQVVFQWGQRRHHTVGFFAPDEPIRINTENLPGGERCRFVVGYSNGLRSTATATSYFALDPQPPTIHITRPAASDVLRPWQPIELRARVEDLQNPPPDDGDLKWEIDAGDGPKEVAMGSVTSIDPLPVGAYLLRVRHDARGLRSEQKLIISSQKGVDTWADTWADGPL
jgi:hypothetical protein